MDLWQTFADILERGPESDWTIVDCDRAAIAGRVERAREAVMTYMKFKYRTTNVVLAVVCDEDIADLIADLLHLADATDTDSQPAAYFPLASGVGNYLAEVEHMRRCEKCSMGVVGTRVQLADLKQGRVVRVEYDKDGDGQDYWLVEIDADDLAYDVSASQEYGLAGTFHVIDDETFALDASGNEVTAEEGRCDTCGRTLLKQGDGEKHHALTGHDIAREG